MSKETKRVAGLVLELAVVFLGVLIALAADAWWQGREEVQRELSYLEAIRIDMEQATLMLDTAVVGDSTLARGTNRLLGLLRSDSVPISEEWRASTPFFVSHLSLPLGTLRSLLGGPDLRLIRSEELRTTLISAASRIDTNLDWVDEVTGQATQNVQSATIEMETLRIEEGGRSVVPSLAAMRRSPRVVAAYMNHLTILANRIVSLRATDRAVDEVLEAVEAELERRGRR